MTSDKTATGLSGSEFRAEFGYGISTQADKPIVELGKGEANVRIFDDLVEADQVAYLRQLYGTDPEATWAYSIELEDFSRTGGCTRNAAGALFTAAELTQTYINPADVLVENDERVQAALEEFASCMNDAGFEYSHPDEVEDELYVRFAGIVGEADLETLTGSALEALIGLQDDERAVAPVAERCEISFLEPVADQVEREVFGSSS